MSILFEEQHRLERMLKERDAEIKQLRHELDVVRCLVDGTTVDRLCADVELSNDRYVAAATENDRLREQVAALQASSGYEASIAQVEIDRLRAALHDISGYPHCGPMMLRSIARAALAHKP